MTVSCCHGPNFDRDKKDFLGTNTKKGVGSVNKCNNRENLQQTG